MVYRIGNINLQISNKYPIQGNFGLFEQLMIIAFIPASLRAKQQKHENATKKSYFTSDVETKSDGLPVM